MCSTHIGYFLSFIFLTYSLLRLLKNRGFILKKPGNNREFHFGRLMATPGKYLSRFHVASLHKSQNVFIFSRVWIDAHDVIDFWDLNKLRMLSKLIVLWWKQCFFCTWVLTSLQKPARIVETGPNFRTHALKVYAPSYTEYAAKWKYSCVIWTIFASIIIHASEKQTCHC
jgi:hypothetical protein